MHKQFPKQLKDNSHNKLNRQWKAFPLSVEPGFLASVPVAVIKAFASSVEVAAISASPAAS